jgi:hypothetical protein
LSIVATKSAGLIDGLYGPWSTHFGGAGFLELAPDEPAPIANAAMSPIASTEMTRR